MRQTHPAVKIITRTLLILVAAGVVVLGATAFAYSPLAAHLPRTLISVGDEQRDAPPAAVRGARPVRGAPVAQNNAGVNAVFSGRNLPSLQRGLGEELRYIALFAALTALVALALRILRPRRRRRAGTA